MKQPRRVALVPIGVAIAITLSLLFASVPVTRAQFDLPDSVLVLPLIGAFNGLATFDLTVADLVYQDDLGNRLTIKNGTFSASGQYQYNTTTQSASGTVRLSFNAELIKLNYTSNNTVLSFSHFNSSGILIIDFDAGTLDVIIDEPLATVVLKRVGLL